MSCGDAVDDPRIPVVQHRAQVVEEDHRHAVARTELPVGEVRSAHIDHAGRRVLVCSTHSHCLLLTSITTSVSSEAVRSEIEGCGLESWKRSVCEIGQEPSAAK